MEGAADRSRLLLAVGVAAVTVIALLQLAQRRGPLAYSALIAASAGICYAMSAAMIKVTTDSLLTRGVAATALDWPGYLIAVTTFSGLVLGHQAYGSGSLSVAVAVMSIVNPAASFALGLLAFDVTPVAGPGPLAAVAVSGVLLAVGSVRPRPFACLALGDAYHSEAGCLPPSGVVFLTGTR